MKERVQGHLSNETSAMQLVDLNGKGKLRCNSLEPSPFFGTTKVLLFSLVLEIRQLSNYPCCGLGLRAKVFQHPQSECYAFSRTTGRYSFQKVLVHLPPLQNPPKCNEFFQNTFDFQSPGSLTLGRDTAENHSRCTWHHELDCETWAMRILRQTHPQKRKALFATLPS